MIIGAKLHVTDENILAHYNDEEMDAPLVAEIEEYVGHERPFNKKDIPLLVEYHLLDEDEMVYVETTK